MGKSNNPVIFPFRNLEGDKMFMLTFDTDGCHLSIWSLDDKGDPIENKETGVVGETITLNPIKLGIIAGHLQHYSEHFLTVALTADDGKFRDIMENANLPQEEDKDAT